MMLSRRTGSTDITMTRVDNKYEGKWLWILIQGCTEPPNTIEAVKRKDIGGRNFYGMKHDLGKIQSMIEKRADYEIYNIVENRRSLQCKTVLKELRKAAEFAKNKGCTALNIYYSGYGEMETGNWVFSDGVLKLDKVLKSIKQKWGKEGVNLFVDASYSGNWALDIRRFKNWRISCAAASYPHKVAYDTENGGLFTLYLSKNMSSTPQTPDNDWNKMYWCAANIHDAKYSVKYYHAFRLQE